jgi:hypothetical protein
VVIPEWFENLLVVGAILLITFGGRWLFIRVLDWLEERE